MPEPPAQDDNAAPAPTSAPRSDTENGPDSSSTSKGNFGSETATPPPPMPPVKTVPQGSVPPAPPTTPAQEELYKVSVNVNFVLVPVTVKDNDGRLVAGLQSKDFTV